MQSMKGKTASYDFERSEDAVRGSHPAFSPVEGADVAGRDA